MTIPTTSLPRAAAHTKTKVLRFASYLRCSSDDQKEGDFSTIDNQREMARAYIDRRIAEIVAKGGRAEFVGFYDDEGKTGTNLRRKGYQRLRTDAQAGVLSVVVVTYMSRLGRGRQFDIAEDQLSEAGATVELVQEHFTEDMAGYVNKRVTNLMDEMYPRQVSVWTKTKQVGMVAAGYFTGGYVPYGYRSEAFPGMEPVVLQGGKVKPPPKRLVPFEPEAQHVREAMQVFVLTRNMGAVLRYLREAASERRWTMDQVRLLLMKDACRGVHRFGPNVNYTAFEPIVGEQLWDAVQANLQARQEAKEAKTSDNGDDALAASERPAIYNMPNRVEKLPYYLRGIVFCPHCGSRMTPTGAHGSSGKLGYYVCVNGGNRSKSDQPCPVRRVNAVSLHTAVLGEIARITEHPTRLALLLREAVKALPSATGLQDELKRELRNRREAEKKIAKAVSAVLNGNGVGVQSYTKAIGEQEAVKAEVEKRIADIEGRVKASTAQRPDEEALRALWGAFLANWEYLTEAERTELMPLLVERVTMEEKGKGDFALGFAKSPS